MSRAGWAKATGVAGTEGAENVAKRGVAGVAVSARWVCAARPLKPATRSTAPRSGHADDDCQDAFSVAGAAQENDRPTANMVFPPATATMAIVASVGVSLPPVVATSGQLERSVVVAELVVRNVEEIVSQKLHERAAAHGVSAEEEHRRILRRALLGAEVARDTTDFKEYLLSMPDVGDDSDFRRVPGAMREVDFSE
jgi:hypothetical protein